MRLNGDPTGEWTAELEDRLSGSRIPSYMHHGLIMYIVHRIPSGDFLMAVFANDLRMAVQLADLTNRDLMFDYVSFMYSSAPSGCWGSPEKVTEWLKYCGACGAERAKTTRDRKVRIKEMKQK
jgi:hypothetical protein